MNKAELVQAVAEKTGLTKKDTQATLNALVETVKETVAEGEKVQLVGFGTFSRRERAARLGRNPKNPQETIKIAACKVPAFKAGKDFKAVTNK